MSLTERQTNLLSLALVAPAFAYLALDLLVGYTGWDAASAAGFVLVPLLLLVGLIPLWGPFLELLGFVGVTAGVILGVLSSPTGGPGIDFAAGILLSSPFLLGSWAWTPKRTAPARLIGLGLGLFEGIILLAALRLLVTNGEVETSALLFYNYTSVNLLQLCGVAGFLNVVPSGCPSDLSFLPLRDIVDPTFVVLAGLALLGVLAPVLSPRTARGLAGDAESYDEFAESARVRADLPLSSEMMRGLAQRTPPRPGPGILPPGSGALLLSASITLIFVAAAISAPTQLLLPTLLAVLLVLGGVLVIGRPARRPRERLSTAPHARAVAPGVGPAGGRVLPTAPGSLGRPTPAPAPVPAPVPSGFVGPQGTFP